MSLPYTAKSPLTEYTAPIFTTESDPPPPPAAEDVPQAAAPATTRPAAATAAVTLVARAKPRRAGEVRSFWPSDLAAGNVTGMMNPSVVKTFASGQQAGCTARG